VVAAELGAQPEAAFAHFEPQPVAAASLGQVHFATLASGAEVAVKVQRPSIDAIVKVDLDALNWVVSWLKFYKPISRRADLQALLDEFADVTRAELDYTAEARNAETFHRLLRNEPAVSIPHAYTALTTRRVLIMERINGIKITNYAALQAAGVDRHALADQLFKLYLRQILFYGVFHADPHPGNLFIRPVPAGADQPWELVLIDFGMVGQVNPALTQGLREGLIGVVMNDPERILTALERVGVILPGADHQQIIQGLQVIMRYAYNRTLRELTRLDISAMAGDMRDLVYQMPFQLPQDLILLGRAVGVVSGICTGLAPNFNLFEAARPFARDLLHEEHTGRQLLERIEKEARDLLRLLIKLPRKLDGVANTLLYGEFQVRPNMIKLERRLARLERSMSRLAGGIVATGLFLGGVALETNGTSATWIWLLSGMIGLWTLWPRPDWGK
jgi:predicted unusual protein kinase regulating ubiquinone biosynthesis (AarF/ABC1/UbiB family)